MASVFALRALLGAGLGLGALDLVWIDAALVPQLTAHDSVPVVTMAVTPTAPIVTPIEEPPAPPPAPVIDHVYFETGSARLTGSAHKALAELVALAGPAAEIALAGHADYRGTESLNTMLSKDRALAVQQELVRLGIDAARIRVDYTGETQASSELWRDRRVDIQMIGVPR